MKSEKIKFAMKKLKEANVQKVSHSQTDRHMYTFTGDPLTLVQQMVLKAYNVDGSSKMIAIHGGMSAREVCFMLADRNHQDLGPNWTIVEKLTDLHLGKGTPSQILRFCNVIPRFGLCFMPS